MINEAATCEIYWRNLAKETSHLSLKEIKKFYNNIRHLKCTNKSNIVENKLHNITFTPSQSEFINYINNEVKNNRQFLGILSGSVGCGKTLLLNYINKSVKIISGRNNILCSITGN